MQGEELLEVEPRHRHDRGAGGQTHVHEHLHAVDVEERQHRDERLVLVEGDHRCRLREVGHQVAVGEHHALGQAGGARRVGQHHHVVEVDGHLLGQRVAEERRQGGHSVRLADHEQLLHRGVLHGLGGDLEEHRDRDQPGRAGVDELVVHLAGRVGGVDRGDHPAGQRDGVEHHAVLGAVRRHDRQHLALGEPGGHQPAGEAANGVVELGVGHRAAGRAVDERGAVAARAASARTNGVSGTSGRLTSGSGLVKVTVRPLVRGDARRGGLGGQLRSVSASTATVMARTSGTSMACSMPTP